METNSQALEQAATLDLERERNVTRGPLHGIPILVKDNMATDVEIDGAYMVLVVAQLWC